MARFMLCEGFEEIAYRLIERVQHASLGVKRLAKQMKEDTGLYSFIGLPSSRQFTHRLIISGTDWNHLFIHPDSGCSGHWGQSRTRRVHFFSTSTSPADGMYSTPRG